MVAFAACLGLVLIHTRWGEPWVRASYDHSTRWWARSTTNRPVLIEMDSSAYAALQQTRNQPWDRRLHAGLLQHLKRDGNRVAVFDVLFANQREPGEDEALREAIREHGGAVLLAGLTEPSRPKTFISQVILPHPRFREGISRWGIGQVEWDEDGVVRRHWSHASPTSHPSLPSAIAQAAKGDPPKMESPPPFAEKWMRYYQSDSAWERISYHLATNQPPGFYRDRVVFIGNRPKTPVPGDEEDEFRTPDTWWTGRGASGMEIMATCYLNLTDREWLNRPSPWIESVAVAGVAWALGMVLPMRRRPRLLLPLCLLSLLLVAVLTAVCLPAFSNWWFPWWVVVGGQIPAAFALDLIARIRRPVSTQEAAGDSTVGHSDIRTPGYERYLRPIGEGAYGVIHLARNTADEWQALKVIYRSRFADSQPYDREYEGIKRYKPLSAEHPGLLRVEFVSAPQPEGYFYYVMELGDSETAQTPFNPLTYRAQDLDRVCQHAANRRLPLTQCLRIGIALAGSLGFLHGRGLIHRDIKPSNVIFVKGIPKLADVGLVAKVANTQHAVSFLGTVGYLPPEGPGDPRGDVYALGMLLYVISTGHPPSRGLDLPTGLVETEPDFMRLNALLCKACHPNPDDRFQSALEFKAALETLVANLPSRP